MMAVADLVPKTAGGGLCSRVRATPRPRSRCQNVNEQRLSWQLSVKEQLTIDHEQSMTIKLTATQLDWLKFLLENGPNAGANFGNRVKGTCARRSWAEWDRQ